jgi:hypothetical protein
MLLYFHVKYFNLIGRETFEKKYNKNEGNNVEYKHQTENAVDWKCLFATVNVDLIIAKHL